MEFVFALIVPKLVGGTPKEIGVWRFLLCFPNVGFIGYPLVEAIFGHTGLFYAVILVMPFNLLNYSLGPLMLSGKIRFHWKQLLSPLHPHGTADADSHPGGHPCPAHDRRHGGDRGRCEHPAFPAGAGLHAGGHVRPEGAHLRADVGFSPRCACWPCPRRWAWCCISWAPIPWCWGVAVAQMAMPVAVNGTMLCLEFDGDVEAMAQVTFMTTVLSIVTIPLAVSLFV